MALTGPVWPWSVLSISPVIRFQTRSVLSSEAEITWCPSDVTNADRPRSAGPDFVHASLRVDGEQVLEGDIELDIHVADWDRHGHSQNPAFDRVILHLFLHKGGASHFTRTTLNREVIQIHLQSEIDLLQIQPLQLLIRAVVARRSDSCRRERSIL